MVFVDGENLAKRVASLAKLEALKPSRSSR